jgi:ribosomal protein S16
MCSILRHDQDMAKRYWYNTVTGEVEEGRQSSWTRRLGPYATREEAQRAVEIAKQRAKEWDEDDDRRRWGEG